MHTLSIGISSTSSADFDGGEQICSSTQSDIYSRERIIILIWMHFSQLKKSTFIVLRYAQNSITNGKEGEK